MNAFHYFLEGRAQKEYETSVSWYAERSKIAPVEFIKAIDALLDLICKHPYRYKKNYKNYHEAVVKRYPFSIIYTVEDLTKSIVIVSIFHHKRNPKRKYK